MASALLPIEIWSHILRQVPKSNLSQVLEVCSLFHDLAVPILFESIKIYFMNGQNGLSMLNTDDSLWMEEIAYKLMRRSWELLNHIAHNLRFASYVKSITVIAYADGLSVFEQLTLANTMAFVSNLQTFRWIGNNPVFDETVAKRLPPTLQRLVVQSHLPLNDLPHFQNLSTLHLSIPFLFPDDEEAHDDFVHDALLESPYTDLQIAATLEDISSNLTSLRITASDVRGVPIRLYSQLKGLEIFGTIGDDEELVGLDLVFRYATSLESLSLVGYFVPAMFSFFLPFSSDTLPHLTSFRLSCDYSTLGESNDWELQSLCQFLQGRALLRRLYLRIPTITWGHVMSLFPTIKDLAGLEVLGLHTGKEFIAEDALYSLAQILSPKLRALHLGIRWDGASILPLVDAIGTLPRLSFVHLYGAIGRLPLQIADFAVQNEALQTIGLNRALWTISRVGPDILTEKWPRWKIKFCVEEDFICEDDAWLFKYY
ncbi:unnamed protein product [Cyclocybe aegerita]|uniref:F-box domain-containing protein n=1 Tax=Cyclocybe aegerita TaxID=1973307 RepID=A0A8S0WUP4_CYCAE|nr:unnamed protein product [Cyclocybe aegerita]